MFGGLVVGAVSIALVLIFIDSWAIQLFLASTVWKFGVLFGGLAGGMMDLDTGLEDTEAAYVQANIQYLVEDAQREGTIVRASGLQIHIIRRGDGGIAGAGQQVIVHYEGSLIDGTIFDSSYTRGQPSTFPINEIIRGWQEAMTLMTVGSKWEIVMPARLGYGSRADIDV